MTNLPLVRLISIGLRGLTLLAKFSLLFVLAYYLEPREVAVYGLFVATVAYSIFALGFNFYSFSTREILGSSPRQWAMLLRDQSVFFGLVYVFILPLFVLLFFLGFLPWVLAPWFFVIVVLEHLGQELNRLLVAMSRQLLAGFALFLRSGVWAFFVAFIFWSSESDRNLELVFYLWVAGASLGCLVGVLALSALDRGCLINRIDWLWVGRGVKVALPLLIATLAIRSVFTIDRYWVESVLGSDILAAYVIFAGVANAVIAFLEAGVFVFLYPKIISSYKNNDFQSFRVSMILLLKQTLVVVLLLSLLASIAIHPVLSLIQKDVYSQHVEILYILLLAATLYSIGMVPHYGIYAMSKDGHIVVSHILGLCVFLMFGVVLESVSPLYAVPLALCASFSFIFIYKSVVYLLLKAKLPLEGACKGS